MFGGRGAGHFDAEIAEKLNSTVVALRFFHDMAFPGKPVKESATRNWYV